MYNIIHIARKIIKVCLPALDCRARIQYFNRRLVARARNPIATSGKSLPEGFVPRASMTSVNNVLVYTDFGKESGIFTKHTCTAEFLAGGARGRWRLDV